ncbi:MAG: class II aldolase/adducin family protein [Pirellulaceae bacterium]
MRRHGIYTWGKDVDEAFRQIEVLEFLLECSSVVQLPWSA